MLYDILVLFFRNLVHLRGSCWANKGNWGNKQLNNKANVASCNFGRVNQVLQLRLNYEYIFITYFCTYNRVGQFEDAIKPMTELFMNNVGVICQIQNLSKETHCLEVLVLACHLLASSQKGE